MVGAEPPAVGTPSFSSTRTLSPNPLPLRGLSGFVNECSMRRMGIRRDFGIYSDEDDLEFSPSPGILDPTRCNISCDANVREGGSDWSSHGSWGNGSDSSPGVLSELAYTKLSQPKIVSMLDWAI